MEEEKIQQLLKYLATVDFTGPSFEQEVRQHIASDSRYFKVKYSIPWDKELMRFDLEFEKDLQFQGYRLAYYKATHITAESKETSRNFSPSTFGLCNATLAFYIVSGRLDDLIKKLSSIELEQFPGVHLVPKIEELLSQNHKQFELKYSRNEPEGFIEYIIPVSQIEGWYQVDKYKAILTPYPAVQHGKYNSIDTSALEYEMRKINWHNDRELFIFHEDTEPEFTPKVGDIQEQMYRLSQDLVGADIADQLQLKYWKDASFFEDMLQQSAWDYLETLPKREQNYPAEVPAKVAFNSLCGRAVYQQRVYPFLDLKPAWVRFDFTTIGSSGGYLTEIMPDFDQAQLDSILDNLPIPPGEYSRIKRNLNMGDLTPLALPNKKILFLEANPEQKTVNVYTQNMRPVMVNFHFDPDWQPVQHQELIPEELKRKPRQNMIQPDESLRKNNPFRRRR